MIIMILVLVLPVCSGAVTVTINPPGVLYPINGTKFSVQCYIKENDPSGPIPDGQFKTVRNLPYKNSSDERIYILKSTNAATKEQNLTITWNPIYTTDEEEHQCSSSTKGSSIAAGFDTYVIPDQSIPEIEMEPKTVTKVTKGQDIKLRCQSSVKVTSKIKSLKIEWTFNGMHDTVADNANVTTNSAIVYEKSSILHIRGMKKDNVGRYYCKAVLEMTKKAGGKVYVADKFYKTIDVKMGSNSISYHMQYNERFIAAALTLITTFHVVIDIY